MAVIAMTREMGTRGNEVAAKLAERLGLTVVHHELVEHDIALHAGMQDSEVHHLLEGEASLRERWKIDRSHLSFYTAAEILELAVKGNVLIRGWGASYLLRDVPHIVCVRVCAPIADRVAVLMQRQGIANPALAQAEIRRSDARHNGTVQRLFGADWTDASLYAAVLNTARVPIDDCVEHIVRLVESPAFAETPRSRAALMDRVLESRVRGALDKAFGMSMVSPAIEVAVDAGQATLTGAVADTDLIVQAIRVAQDVEGVAGVESRVSHISFGSF